MVLTRDRHAPTTKPVLMVHHAEGLPPGLLLQAMEAADVELRHLRPFRGDRFPEIDEIAGLVLMGGPMNTSDTDRYPWLSDECRFASEVIARQIPAVGICLGGQLLAKALGGTVRPCERAEVGWHEITLRDEALTDPVFSRLSRNIWVYQWHWERFSSPPSAVVLASSQTCGEQAFRYGDHVYGLQFHPETDARLFLKWMSDASIDDELCAAQARFGRSSVQCMADQLALGALGEHTNAQLCADLAKLFRPQTELVAD